MLVDLQTLLGPQIRVEMKLRVADNLDGRADRGQGVGRGF
jgi:hypothetical protein